MGKWERHQNIKISYQFATVLSCATGTWEGMSSHPPLLNVQKREKEGSARRSHRAASGGASGRRKPFQEAGGGATVSLPTRAGNPPPS